MLQGHDFARAVRGHLLVQTVLSNVVLDIIEITEEEQACVTEIMSSVWDEHLLVGRTKRNPVCVIAC